MGRAPFRRCFSTLFLLVLFMLVSSPVAAQQPDLDVSFGSQVGGTVIGTLVLGSGLLLLAPDYTTRTTERIHTQPVSTFAYGLGLGIATVFISVVLVVILRTIGLLLVTPLLFTVLLVGQLGYLSVGTAFADSWVGVLLIATVTAAIAGGVPLLGGLIGLVLNSLGLGAAYLDYRDQTTSG